MSESEHSFSRKNGYESLATLIDALDQKTAQDTAIYALHRQSVETLQRAKLYEKIMQAAAKLQQAGVAKGDTVVLWDENSPAWISACLAVIRIGGYVVPLDVQHGRQSLERIIEDCQPRCILAGSERQGRLEELSCELPEVLLLDPPEEAEKSLWNFDGDCELPELAEEDGAALFYTSGTTGPPKGVPLTHRNLVFQINRILETGLVRPDDRLLLPLPLHHVYPFVMGMLLPLALQIPIILPLALTGPQIIRAVEKGGATIICGVPRLHRALLDALNERLSAKGELVEKLFGKALQLSVRIRLQTGWNIGRLLFSPLHRRIGPHLRLMTSGGSPLDPDLARALTGLGWDVAIGYGLTETAPLLTINPPGSIRFDSVGKAIDGVDLKLDRQASDTENEGEVLARGPNVFAGYHRQQEETEKVFTDDGWFRTGDLGVIDEEGYLTVRGRVSTLIVTESGKNIYPEEVEDAYQACPGVKEIGVLDDDNRLVALVVPEDGEDDTHRDQLEQALAQAAEDLPSYWQLSGVTLTTRALPRTRLGKLRRHKLRECYNAAKHGEDDSRQREGPLPLEEMSGEDRALLDNAAARTTWDWLAHRYSDRSLRPDSRLQSDLGIDSLEWLTVTVEVGERTGVELHEEAIAELKTVRDLLKKISSGTEEGETSFSGDPLADFEKILSGEQTRRLESQGRVLHFIQRLGFALNRLVMMRYFKLHVAGLDHLPDKQCVYAPNHLSSLDPLAIAAALPGPNLQKTWWGGWVGIAFRNLAARTLSRLANVVPVDPDRAVISSLAFGAAVLDKGHSLVWFPEGQRSRDGKLAPFKPGIGLLVNRYPVPILPIMIAGTDQLLPPGRLLPRRGTITLVFGKALEPDELFEAGQDPQAAARAIAERLREEVRSLQEQHAPGESRG